MASFPSSLSRSFKCNSPFTPEQSSWIVLMYGEVKLLKQVRRTFRLHFCRVSNRKIARIPNLLAFSMAWLGIVAGKCLQAHWFDGAVDGAAYLDSGYTENRRLAGCASPGHASPVLVLVSAGRRVSTHHRTCHEFPPLQVRR